MQYLLSSTPISPASPTPEPSNTYSQNGWIGIYPHSSKVKLPENSLAHTTSYSFGRKFNSFPFCSTCGVCVFQTLIGPPKTVVDGLSEAGKERVKQMLEIQPVNFRCLEGVDVDQIVRTRNDEGTEGYEKAVLGFERGEE